MSWQLASWLLLGGSTVLLFLGLPVVFSFLVINVIGAWLILGGEAGIAQMVRNCVGSVASFSLTPIPLFVLMGEVLFHTGLAVKVIDGIERLIKTCQAVWPWWRSSPVRCFRPSRVRPLPPLRCWAD